MEAAANRPDVPHYTVGGIECIDYLKAKLSRDEFQGFCRGNAIKYLSRLGRKVVLFDDVAADARKAEVYCRWLAESLEEQAR